MAHGVLVTGRMKSALLVAGCLAITAVSSTASAGGYLGVSLGTEPSMDGKVGSVVASPTGRSLRGLIGTRFGNVSLEGALNGFDMTTAHFGEQTAYQLSAALKLSLPIGQGFEVFARGGLERTWLSMGSSDFDFTGDGFLLGAGFEYRLDAVLTNASVFVDYNFHRSTMKNLRDDSPEDMRMWSIGVTIGI